MSQRYPEKGESSPIYFSLGCLLYKFDKLNLACKCFIKSKLIKDQFNDNEDVLCLKESSCNNSSLLNNIACCLISLSKN